MKRLPRIFWLLMASLLPALSACGGGATATSVDTAPIHTQIASTAMALQTQTALAVPTATDTPLASATPEGTNTPLITDTPLVGTPSATPLTLKTPLATSQTSCDNMKYVTDVNIPDGYVAAPGEVMDKTWRFTNLGPCTWDQDYTLIFSYDNVNGATGWANVKPVHFPDVIAPNSNMEITVTLKAPNDPGTYKGWFRLRNDKGYTFGPEFWIQIVVK